MHWVIYENITCSVGKRIPQHIQTALYIDFPALLLLLMPFFLFEHLAFRWFLKVHSIVRGQTTTLGGSVRACLTQLSGFLPKIRHHGVLLNEHAEICIHLLSSNNTHGKDYGLYLLHTICWPKLIFKFLFNLHSWELFSLSPHLLWTLYIGVKYLVYHISIHATKCDWFSTKKVRAACLKVLTTDLIYPAFPNIALRYQEIIVIITLHFPKARMVPGVQQTSKIWITKFINSRFVFQIVKRFVQDREYFSQRPTVSVICYSVYYIMLWGLTGC